MLDLGCGPGYWTAYLHQLGVEASGVDVVPEFIEHARAHHPGPQFELSSMTDVHEPEQSAVGFFAGNDQVAAFDHAVTTAYRWPPDRMAEHLAGAGFAEVERVQRQTTMRPDRMYAAIAARAV